MTGSAKINLRRWLGGAVVWHWLALGLFAPLAWLSLLMLPTLPVVPELDMSWAGALPYFASRGFHFGKEVIFTYGPLGYLTGYAYVDYLFSQRTVWEFAVKAVFVILFCGVLRRLSIARGFALAVCIILFLGNYEEAYTFAIVSVALLLLDPHKDSLCLIAALGLFLSALALVKFDYFLESLSAVTFALSYYAIRQRWSAVAVLGSSYGVGVILFWLIAGQNLADFPTYVVNSLAITAGYNTAMSTSTENVALVWIALLGSVFVMLELIFYILRAQDKARMTIGSLLLAVIMFFLWKHAFIRGQNHWGKFCSLFPAIALASGTLRPKAEQSTTLSTSLVILALVSALVGMEIANKAAIPLSYKHWPSNVRHAWNIVANYSQFRQRCRAALQATEREYSLPQVKSIARDGTTDVIGYRQGIALLNRLNYIPRPVFQGYSAYTPSLMRINRNHYRSPNAPEFVLGKLETIDKRFPTLDDAGVLIELLSRYRPVLAEKHWQLWQATPSPVAEEPKLISAMTSGFGEEIVLPQDRFIWAQFVIRQSWWGKIVSFLYRTSPVFLDLQDDVGNSVRFRIVPSMSASGFLLNPEVKNDDDLVAVANGYSLHRFRTIKFVRSRSATRYFKNNVEIMFYTVPSLLRLPLRSD